MLDPVPRTRVRMWIAAASVAAIVAALFLVRTGAPERPQLAAAGSEKLRIAVPLAPQSGLLHIAAATGQFAGEGLEVTLIPVSHGKVGIDQVLEGKVDLAVASEVPFVIAVMKGEALSMPLNMLDIANGNAVIGRRDRGIAGAADLPGKKVAVTFGTSGDYHLWAFLIRHRIEPTSVTLVDVPPGRIAQDVASGAVDAVSTWKPLIFDVQSALGDNGLTLPGDNGYAQMYALVARRDFVDGHRGAMEKLARALLKAESFATARPDEALRLVAGWTNTDIKVLQPIWKDLDYRVNLLQSHLITLEDEARWAMGRGYATAGPVPNFLPYLYLDALLAARPGRVTVVH